MKEVAKPVLSVDPTIRMLLRWVTSVPGEAVEAVVFTSGAVLAMLDVVLRDA